MPKKGKKDPTADMTEEERVLYLQQKAQAEEEAARKKEELLTLFLKDKLQREESNTAVNLLKVNDGWRSILRQARTAELRHDITVLSQTFERHLDGLDCLLRNLECDIQKADQQSSEVRCIHIRNLSRLQALQNKRLMALQEQWESGLQLLTSKFNCERKQMLADTRQQRALEDVAFTAEQQNKAVMDETDTLYSDVITTYQGAHHSWTTNMTQATKEEIIQKQEDERVCNRETKKLDQLLSRNQQLIQSTDSEMKRAEKLQEAVILMRQMLSSDKSKKQSVEEDLIAEGNYVKQKTRELRDQLIRAQTEARRQLSDLTIQSNNTTKKLQAIITKGERVLRVAEMYHKLENEQRSISSALFLAEEPEGPEPAGQTKEVSELLELPHLMRSINSAVLHREALRRHKDDMSQENQQLRLLLHQHLDAMTLSEDALYGSHPLLAVSPAPTTAAPLDNSRHYTVIEAVHAAKHSL